METQEIFEKVIEIIKGYVKEPERLENASMDTAIIQDLKVNSARLVDIIIKSEDAFDIEIDDDDADEEGDEIVGNETRVKVIKNKVAPPFKQTEFQILYGKGIYRLGEVVDLGVQLGLVNKAGAWYSYKGERIGQGKKNACEYLTEHAALGEEIEGIIRAKLLNDQSAVVEEAPIDEAIVS